MATRPGCGASSCPFFLEGGPGVDITGQGSINTPWEIRLFPFIGGMYTYSKEGYWNIVPEAGNATTTTVANNTLYLLPFSYSRQLRSSSEERFRLTGVAIEVTTAATAGTARAGLYTTSGVGIGMDLDLVDDFGNASSNLTTTGVKTWAVTSSAFQMYTVMMIGIAFQGVTGAPAVRARQTWGKGILASTPVFTTNPTAYTVSGVSGALPTAEFALPTTIATGPAVLIQPEQVV